jgi:hypothetical protein
MMSGELLDDLLRLLREDAKHLASKPNSNTRASFSRAAPAPAGSSRYRNALARGLSHNHALSVVVDQLQ